MPPRVTIISKYELSGKYVVDMLGKAGAKTELLIASRVGIAPKRIKEITQIIKKFDIVHLISGCQRIKFLIWLRLLGKKTINHWIGTDVLRVSRDTTSRLLARITDKLIDIQFAQLPNLVEELKIAGIKADYLPIVPPVNNQLAITHKQGILMYVPWDRVDFHRGSELLELAKMFPDINFHIVDNEGKGLPSLPNIHYRGWVSDMDEVWENVSILVRFPKHDGLSSMVLEALARGKWVIWNQHLSCCSYIQKIEDIPQELKKLLDKKMPNIEGRKFVLSEFDPQKIGEKYVKIYNSMFPARA